MPLHKYFHLTARYNAKSFRSTNHTPKSLTADRLEALLQMQKTDPFARGSPNAYPMEKHHNIKPIFIHMPEAYYINM